MFNGAGPHFRTSVCVVHSKIFSRLTRNNLQSPKYPLGEGCVRLDLHFIDFDTFNPRSLERRFSNPLLSVVGQRLVLNLRGQKNAYLRISRY